MRDLRKVLLGVLGTLLAGVIYGAFDMAVTQARQEERLRALEQRVNYHHGSAEHDK